jgi:hypothetical protein
VRCNSSAALYPLLNCTSSAGSFAKRRIITVTVHLIMSLRTGETAGVIECTVAAIPTSDMSGCGGGSRNDERTDLPFAQL